MSKQRTDTLSAELASLTLDNLSSRELRISALLTRITPDLVEHLLRKPSLSLVLVRKTLHDGHSLGLAALGKEEFGRFEHLEDDETHDPLEEGDGAEGEGEVTPAHVVGFATAVGWAEAGVQVARVGVVLEVAGVGWDKTPGDHGCDQSAYGPPDTQKGEQVTGGERQEFEEERAVDGEITADADTCEVTF